MVDEREFHEWVVRCNLQHVKRALGAYTRVYMPDRTGMFKKVFKKDVRALMKEMRETADRVLRISYSTIIGTDEHHLRLEVKDIKSVDVGDYV